jgi:hypothetical protein
VFDANDESQTALLVKMPLAILRSMASHPAVEGAATEITAKEFRPERRPQYDPVMQNPFRRQREVVLG